MAVVKRALPSEPGNTRAPVIAGLPATKFQLATAPSSPSTDMWDYSWLLFGEKKIGKTTLASLMDRAYFLMTEPGAKSLSVYQSAITSWQQLRDAVKALRSAPQFKTVVVDTIDIAFKMAEKAALYRLGIDHPSDETWGKGWAAIRDEFTPWVQELLSIGKGVVFISHATEREIKVRSGESYDRIQPTMSNTARDIVEGMVDIWAYYTYVGKQRTLILRGDNHISAGHRLQNNFRWNGKEVVAVDMGSSPEEGHENLVDCFNNRYNPDAHGKIVLPEPVKKAVKKAKARK